MDQEYLEDKVVTLKKLTGYQRLRDAFGLIMLVVAVYLTIALVSFDRADPSWSQTAWHEPIHNSAGHFGAWCADVLFSIFGGVAYTLPILFFVYCWNAFSRRSPHDLFDYFTFSIRVIGFLALILSSCALADINFDDWHNFSSGGVLGSLISGGVIPKFNHAGATLILLFMWAIGLTLFTGWSWLTITEKIGGIVISVVSFTLNQLRKKNEASAQAKADYEPMDSVNLNTTNERAANFALGAENVNNLSWSGIDEPDVHENQLTLNWDTQNGVEAIDDEKKTSILFSPQYPPINTEPTIASLVPQSSEPFGPNENILATQTESDRISQIVSAVTNSQPSGDTPLATKASSADLSNSPLSDRYSQFERDEFIQAEPDRISQIVSAMTSLQPSDGTPLATKASSADLSNSPLPNRPSQLEQGEFTQATAKLDSPIVNKPIFTPAKTKVIPELPRPNPVRIPTRRELMSYGIRIASRKNIEGVDRQEGSLAAERDSLVDGYNDRLDKASLRDEYSKQQKARYGEEYELDVSIASSNERIQEYKSANSPADDWIEAGIAVSHNRYETLTEPTLTPTPTISAEAEAKKQVLLYEYKDSYTPIPSNSVKSPTQDGYPYNNENVNASTIGAEHVQREADEPLVSETTLTNSDYRTTSFEQTQAYSNPVASRAPISSEPEQCDDSDINEQDDVTALREEPNIGESIIHPFLMRNERPLQKPTTPLPMLDLLTPPPSSVEPIDVEQLEQIARLIEDRLADYRVKASVVDILPGPVITLYELDLAPGVKAARISNLSRDLARSLSTVAVRVVEVIPGRPYVGLELPNKLRQTVYLREVLDCTKFRDIASPLAIVLGKDISGQPVVADLAKMPHVLVAGTTGSGKSVGVNAMIISMLYKATPDDVRFIMIDPKMLELSVYEGIPHLLTEVVTDMKDASNALRWCVGEMERRYKLMSALGVRNLAGYNERIQQAIDMGRPVPDPFWKPSDSMDLSCPTLEKLPYIVVIVDEFADLMMAVGKKVEELIARLAQKARAAGIHLVLATQRPSVDVITGLIKANIPTRIAFTVSSKIDSRTILDQGGAESLLGMGDMLYMAPNSSIPVRVHGAFVRDEEVHAVVQDWKARGKPQYIENITSASEEGDSGLSLDAGEELDPLFDQAVAFVIEKRKPSISGVQRQFRIGYNRAARIVEQMEAQGIVSPPGHNGNREVLAPPPHD